MDMYFHIPDFTVHLSVNALLINSLHDCPEYFHDGLKIASVFGNFFGCVWNGGRYLGGNSDPKAIEEIIKLFNGKGVPLRFTFTNPLLEKKHLGDHLSNQILRLGNGGYNEAIVMSPILEEYIRENYPKYPITSSTCKQIESIDGVKEELKKDYKYVVLDYNFNNKFDLLEQIDEADRSRCEVLVNACCTPNCKRRGDHYRTIGQEQINLWEHNKNLLNKTKYEPQNFQCEFMSNNIYDIKDYSTYVSPKDIFEKYLPMGYNNFKIEGRNISDIALLETYVHYMVKPEYQNEVRLKMLLSLTRKHLHFT